MEFYINVYRGNRYWFGLKPGELYTLQEEVFTSHSKAAKAAEEFADEYEHTVSHEGIVNLRPYFSDAYHAVYRNSQDADRNVRERLEAVCR